MKNIKEFSFPGKDKALAVSWRADIRLFVGHRIWTSPHRHHKGNAFFGISKKFL